MRTNTLTYGENLLDTAEERIDDLADKTAFFSPGVEVNATSMSAFTVLSTITAVVAFLLGLGVAVASGVFAPAAQFNVLSPFPVGPGGVFGVLFWGFFALGVVAGLAGVVTRPRRVMLRHLQTHALWKVMQDAKDAARQSKTPTARALRAPLRSLEEDLRSFLVPLETMLCDRDLNLNPSRLPKHADTEAFDRQTRAMAVHLDDAKNAATAAMAAAWVIQTGATIRPVPEAFSATATQAVTSLILSAAPQPGATHENGKVTA